MSTQRKQGNPETASRLLGKARTAALAAVTLVALAGCGSSDDYTTAPAGGSAEGAVADLAVADSPLGRIVVNGRKMTAYYFTKDTPDSGKSACVVSSRKWTTPSSSVAWQRACLKLPRDARFLNSCPGHCTLPRKACRALWFCRYRKTC